MSDDEDLEFDKAVGKYRMLVGGALAPLRLYGQGHYVDTLIEELVSLAIQLHLKLSGIDIPFTVNDDKLHY